MIYDVLLFILQALLGMLGAHAGWHLGGKFFKRK